jgi:parallel beta-helix repeat protein
MRKKHLAVIVPLLASAATLFFTMRASLRSVTIDPPNPLIQIGETIRLTYLIDGTPAPLGANVRWSSDTPSIASVNPDGFVIGRSPGVVRIWGRLRNVRAFSTVTVAAPPVPGVELCGNGVDDDGDGQIDENPPCMPPQPTGRGPQATIICPAGSRDVFPGQSLQEALDASASVCVRAGIHAIVHPVVPRSGTTITGEYGAILDGASLQASADHHAIIYAHLVDVDDVTLRNLVIRNSPQRCVHAFYQWSDRWVVEHNEITGCRSGISLANASTLRRNSIHHNNGDSQGGLIPNGGYIGSNIRDSLIEDNEISDNGRIQKVLLTTNVTFRNNDLRHNGNGIWYDGDNQGAIIEGNTIEDSLEHGIFYEISGQGVIRQNTIRRAGDSCLFISTSRDLEIAGNTCEDNWRGINLFVACANVHPPDQPYAGAIGWDLRNNHVHDNTIRVPNTTGVIGNALSVSGPCAEPYLDGSKNNRFVANHYVLPSVAGAWWYWQSFKTWAQWQALGHDLTGSVQ